VDFDHFSLDTEKSSEAAGWISDLESRDTGLWARVRWSDAGLLCGAAGSAYRGPSLSIKQNPNKTVVLKG